MNLNDLNPMQRKAAETLEGPVLILAGAGSGKTRTVTYRIANLLEHGVMPWHILALTFTNKAAKQMKTRVEALTGAGAEDMWLGTFHSVCARILRRDIEKLGYKRSFTIYDDDDQNRVIKDCLKQLNLDEKMLPPREIRSKIGDAKNKLYSPDEWFAASDRSFRAGQIHDVYNLYEQKLKNANALDFDDLLLRTLQLFAEHPPVLQYYTDKFTYVHVDEYQDTNTAQYELVRLLTASSRNLCVVGDDDQSIYGWRGADIRNILDFEKDFPDAVVIKLEQNYRSTANILDAANQVIAHNVGRKEKLLWTEDEAGEKIRFFNAGDEREEASWVCERIRQRHREIPYSGFAVLYRTHAQSRVIEEMLVRAAIPYKVFGGTRFYDRKEVKDALAYLRLVCNLSDDVSLKRIINVPRRAIGEATVALLQEEAVREEVPLFSVLNALPDSLGARPRKNVSDFVRLVYSLLTMKEEKPLSEYVEWMLSQVGLKQQLESEDDEEAATRLENLMELVGAAHEFEQKSEDRSLEAFLENVSLVTDLDREGDAPQYVTLMTLHTAKGLEFDTVFLVGMEEGVFPSNRAIMEEGRMEEERRLCYVGITRARKQLYLSAARRRMLYNQTTHNPPSAFLREIPKRLIQDEGPQVQRQSVNMNRPAPSMSRPQSFAGSRSGSLRSNPLNIPGVTLGFSKPAAAAAPQVFSPGDKVMHRKFGIGTVQSVSGRGADTRITIAFSAGGVKEFSLAITPIVKLEG